MHLLKSSFFKQLSLCLQFLWKRPYSLGLQLGVGRRTDDKDTSCLLKSNPQRDMNKKPNPSVKKILTTNASLIALKRPVFAYMEFEHASN